MGLASVPKSTQPVSGEAVGYRRTDSHVGGTPLLRVRLDSGREVEVRVSGGLPVLYGAGVRLLESETYLPGIRRYRFAGYEKGADRSHSDAILESNR